MQKNKNSVCLLIGLALLLIFCSLSLRAEVLTPQLEAALQFSGNEEKIPIIVKFGDKVDLTQFKDPEKGTRRGKLIRSLKDKADLTQGPLKQFLKESGRGNHLKPLHIVNGLALSATPETIQILSQWPGIEAIGMEAIYNLPAPQPAATGTPAWNIAAIHAPQLWGLGYTGLGVVVASMDTGVDASHPALASKWRGGDNSWFDANGVYPAPIDHDGHGTGVMGIMVGGSEGETAIGVAPDAQWIAVKVFDDADPPAANESAILAGFQWLLDPDGDPDTDDAPDVVNNSWGYVQLPGQCVEPDGVREAVNVLKTAGIAVVFSAGNSGPFAGTSESPANYPESFSAGAVSETLQIAGFSSRGPSACDGQVFPDVVAPGVNIRTADLFGLYSFWSGTSFAAPHVAGTMALIMGAFQGLPLVDLELATRYYADDLGLPGPDNDYGYGLINAIEVFNAFQDPAPSVFPVPPSHNFGSVKVGQFSQQAFRIVNRGFGIENLTIEDLFVDGLHSADFDIQNDGCTGIFLAPGEDCGFDVLFSPDAKGAKNAVVHITSNDSHNPVIDLGLTGRAGQVSVGVFRIGKWYLDANANRLWDGPQLDKRLAIGLATDVPMTGDWNGDGVTDIGVFSGGRWYLDTNGNGVWEGPVVDRLIAFGLANDVPVAGDWNGDEVTDLGLFRGGRWYLDANGNGVWEGPLIDRVIAFGLASDVPVTGDWNGDGVTNIGVFSEGKWFLDVNGDYLWSVSQDEVVSFGLSTDLPISGDW